MSTVSIAPKPEVAPLKTKTSPITQNVNAYLGKSKGSQATTKSLSNKTPF